MWKCKVGSVLSATSPTAVYVIYHLNDLRKNKKEISIYNTIATVSIDITFMMYCVYLHLQWMMHVAIV